MSGIFEEFSMVMFCSLRLYESCEYWNKANTNSICLLDWDGQKTLNWNYCIYL